MNYDIPIPGSTKHKLIQRGTKLFSELGYHRTEVGQVASTAGVTVGALYHHFQSKKNFYGILRDDVSMRIVDRMEAVAESVSLEYALKAGFLAGYDGMIRLKVGRLLSEPDPRHGEDKIAKCLGELANKVGEEAPDELGIVLAEALRSALSYVVEQNGNQESARKALERLL